MNAWPSARQPALSHACVQIPRCAPVSIRQHRTERYPSTLRQPKGWASPAINSSRTYRRWNVCGRSPPGGAAVCSGQAGPSKPRAHVMAKASSGTSAASSDVVLTDEGEMRSSGRTAARDPPPQPKKTSPGNAAAWKPPAKHQAQISSSDFSLSDQARSSKASTECPCVAYFLHSGES
jgi:hypothetical protein